MMLQAVGDGWSFPPIATEERWKIMQPKYDLMYNFERNE